MIRRTPPRRKTGLQPGTKPLKRTGRVNVKSKAGRRMDALRKTAYALVDERSGGRCEGTIVTLGSAVARCPEQATQHHHRRPRRAGGSTDPATETAANIIHVCQRHHDDAEQYRQVAYSIGWLLRATDNPEAVGVDLWCGRVFLTTDGGYGIERKEAG